MRITPPSGFDTAMGFHFVESGADRVVLAWDITESNLQPNGIVHGGTYCGAVESAASWGAALWLGERGTVVGVSNQTDFLKAAGAGRMTATASPVHRGRSQQLWAVEVVDAQDRLVARGQVRLQNLTAQ
ncbi:MAG: thioesterase [Candidatus Nephthysia bennettiae]|nr:MAG: thioesterase [Candidatus Dormibacteraeota bacterium]